MQLQRQSSQSLGITRVQNINQDRVTLWTRNFLQKSSCLWTTHCPSPKSSSSILGAVLPGFPVYLDQAEMEINQCSVFNLEGLQALILVVCHDIMHENGPGVMITISRLTEILSHKKLKTPEASVTQALPASGVALPICSLSNKSRFMRTGMNFTWHSVHICYAPGLCNFERY
jgi:hypothetical protein